MKFSAVFVASLLSVCSTIAAHDTLGHPEHNQFSRRAFNQFGGGQKNGFQGGFQRGQGFRKGSSSSSQTTAKVAGKTITAASKTTTTAASAKGVKGTITTAAGKTTTTAAASATTAASNAGGGDLQSSLTLDPALIGSNLANDGLAGGEPGQVASLTSTDNFINFCASTKQPITNGEQVIGGSCNPVPMGQIPAQTAMPSCKFTNPKNGDTIPANQNFTITLAVKNLETGNFVNAQTNYYAAPQQLNGQGLIVAHSHVVVEKLSALDQTTVTDPTVFAFFKGLNEAAVNGVLSATVTGGLPAGVYKVSSINTSANHVPVLGPVAQHGSFDDVVYFTTK